ncbi:MAG: hypothetical protein CVT77_06550 [Alphaproteobacteria bacterium HGW-Alphaproteobacteria-16]|nr:MAG: hypothetical protein CVT77_06550 [Alphaproteobacteria bacterium HGW-Alphaproteobacteria-16]
MGGVIQQFELVAASASTDGDTLVAASIEVPLLDGAPARTVKLLPIGTFTLRDGRGPYRIRDRAHAEQVVAATRAWLGSADFNWDYNHAVLATGAQGGSAEAVAAGWSKPDTLTVRDDGIYADVEWTPRADERLRAREFRYLSPLFMARPVKEGGDVLHLKNAALTNVGAIDLPAIAASFTGDNRNMDLAALLALLGLSADATKDQVAAAIADLKTPKTPDTSAIAVAAGLAATATVEEVAAAIATLKDGKPDLSGYVPASVVEPMKEQLAKLNRDRLTGKVDELVAAGIIPPTKHKETLDWFEANEVAASAFFKDMPPMLKPGGELDGRKTEQRPADKLTADEVAAANALGIAHADFLKTRNEELVA